MKKTRVALSLMLAATLMGCAHYDPAKYYDANAVEKLGRVTSKEIVGREYRAGSHAVPYLPMPYAGDGTANAIYATALIIELLAQTKAAATDPGIPIYSYQIRAGGDEQFTIVSDFPGYRVGDCVKVFLSPRPDYPRMTSSSGCGPA